jgi:hypothetical protein
MFRATTDIAAAFRVVDRMREKHHVLHLRHGASGGAFALFDRDVKGGTAVVDPAPNAVAEAICLAALRACGVDV